MKTRLTIMIFALFAISACSTTPKVAAVQTQAPTMAANSTQAATTALLANANTRPDNPTPRTQLGETPAAQPSQAADSFGNAEAPLQEMQIKSVYFDFDNYTLKEGEREVVLKWGDFMRTHKNAALFLEGSADERGSSEYNLALGEQRANAVRGTLELIGVTGDRIQTASFGENNPRSTCHEEKCWKENRRVDFIVK